MMQIDPKTQDTAKWDAELDHRGVAAIAAALSGGGVGRGAEFRLFVSDLANPSRAYVEDWLGRKEARATLRETRRFHCIFWPSLVAAGASIVAAWPVLRDWLLVGEQ
jgi:hypothetical protein